MHATNDYVRPHSTLEDQCVQAAHNAGNPSLTSPECCVQAKGNVADHVSHRLNIVFWKKEMQEGYARRRLIVVLSPKAMQATITRH